jgi:hypothetical protein
MRTDRRTTSPGFPSAGTARPTASPVIIDRRLAEDAPLDMALEPPHPRQPPPVPRQTVHMLGRSARRAPIGLHTERREQLVNTLLVFSVAAAQPRCQQARRRAGDTVRGSITHVGEVGAVMRDAARLSGGRSPG